MTFSPKEVHLMSKYTIKHGRHSSHSKLREEVTKWNSKKLRLTGEKIHILDVGCAQGSLLSELKDFRTFEVLGIEPNHEWAEDARSRGYRVLEEPIESAISKLPQNLDLIICGDVLEHLVDPKQVFRSLVTQLKTDGMILVSVPNVAHFSTRISLLFGRFDYAEKGILDETHLRFFTKKTLMESFGDDRLTILDFAYTQPPFEAIFPKFASSRFGSVIQEIMQLFVNLRPQIFAYQFIMIAKKNGE